MPYYMYYCHRQMLTYGRRIPLTEWDYRIQQVDAKTVREVCTRYLYDKCPVIVGIGTSGKGRHPHPI